MNIIRYSMSLGTHYEDPNGAWVKFEAVRILIWTQDESRKLAAGSVRDAVRNDDPQTSSRAWDSTKSRASRLRVLILDLLFKWGADGGTISEIADALGYGDCRDSISPRMPELERKGLIVRSGQTRCPGPGLKQQTVWLHRDFAPNVQTESGATQ